MAPAESGPAMRIAVIGAGVRDERPTTRIGLTQKEAWRTDDLENVARSIDTRKAN
jgi:hypothetical protein